jgi:hypothetical protein
MEIGAFYAEQYKNMEMTRDFFWEMLSWETHLRNSFDTHKSHIYTLHKKEKKSRNVMYLCE